MTVFVLAAVLLTLLTLALLLMPWWRSRRASADFSRELNATIHRDRLAELEQDHVLGTLQGNDYTEAQDELQRQLLEDTAAGERQTVADGSGRSTLIALLLLLPLLAGSLYFLLGTPNALLAAGELQARQSQELAASMEDLIARLEKKMAENPENMEGWAMLARSYKAVGRMEDAEKVFNRMGPALEKSAPLLADFADLLVQKQQGSFAGRPRELLDKALKVDPNDPMSLWLRGTDAFGSGRYKDAIGDWERLEGQLEPGSEDARTIAAGIAEARNKLGPAGKDAGTKKSANPAGAAGKEAVSGQVELAPALRDKARAEDTVFIFARAANADSGGPRMPLAVARHKVADLPVRFSLDDSMAMTPEARISQVPQLRVEVRVSRSGNATPGKGDLAGRSEVIKPGAKNLRVVIDQEIQ